MGRCLDMDRRVYVPGVSVFVCPWKVWSCLRSAMVLGALYPSDRFRIHCKGPAFGFKDLILRVSGMYKWTALKCLSFIFVFESSVSDIWGKWCGGLTTCSSVSMYCM